MLKTCAASVPQFLGRRRYVTVCDVVNQTHVFPFQLAKLIEIGGLRQMQSFCCPRKRTMGKPIVKGAAIERAQGISTSISKYILQ